MHRFCPDCGAYRREKRVDPDGPAVVCPECGRAVTIRRLPLFAIGGASGVGKSTNWRALRGEVVDAVLLDVDALWEPAFAEFETFDYNEYYLRQCAHVAQSGRPVAIFGAEIAIPGVVNRGVHRRYFTEVRYLALVCEESVLRERLRTRPNWTDGDGWTAVDEQAALNRWYRRRGDDPDSPVETIDVTDRAVDETAAAVRTWIEDGLETAGFDVPGA